MTTADPLGLHAFVESIAHGFQANWPLAFIGVAALFVCYWSVVRR